MITKKLLALMLLLFWLASTVSLVTANPVPDFKHTSAYSASYVALIISIAAIASSAIFFGKEKKGY